MSEIFLRDALPVPLMANPGSNVSLSELLERSYGSLDQKISGVWVAYITPQDPGMTTKNFSYWDPTTPSNTRVEKDGVDIGPTGGNSVFVPADEFNDVRIFAGNNIISNVFVWWKIADDGTDQVYQSLQLTTIPQITNASMLSPGADDGMVEPANVVAMAHNFAAAYTGVANPNDCHNIAVQVAAAAGATFSAEDTGSINPADNQEGGFWRIEHNGADHPVANWQTLVQPGDIVRFDWSDPNSSQHTILVTEGLNDAGRIRVLDNGGTPNASGQFTIAEHWGDFDGSTSVPASVTIYRLTDDHRYLLNGSDLSDTLIGTVVKDNIDGGNGGDTIYGGDGDDWIDGGDGDDTLDGGRGGDYLLGGDGNDTVTYADSFGGVIADLDDSLKNDGEALGDVYWYDIENLTGSNYAADWLFGDVDDNVLTGLGGEDILNGRGGFDTLRGGNDGDNYYLLDATEYDIGNGILVDRFDAVEETGGGGIDRVWVSSEVPSRFSLSGFVKSYTLTANIEDGVVDGSRDFVLTGNELNNSLFGNSAANYLYGLGGNDSLYGFDGADLFFGGAGQDGMDGGDGEDVFVVDNGTEIGGDVVVGGDGQDEVWTDASIMATGLRLDLFAKGTPITATVNRVPYTSAAIDVEMVHGSGGNDAINASRLVDESVGVEAYEGNDLFISGGDWDIFDGGADTDTIAYAGAASNYVITAGDPGSNTFAIEDLTTGYFDLVHDVELVRFNDVTTTLAVTTHIVGTDGANVLVGDAANNIMDGLGGDDVLTGGAGADSFVGGTGRDLMYVDAQDTSIQGGDGFDIVYADAGTAATGLRFAHAGTGVEAAFGGAGNDVLDASGAANFYNMSFGGAGNDVLIASSAGNYTLQGGAGIDTAVFAGNQSDYTIDGGTPIGWPSWLRVTNNATGATSWLQTVERLQFADGTIDAPGLLPTALGTAGADVINAVAGGQVIHGLAGDDRLTGGSGEDVLDGGAGADRMSGGAGNDSFFIDNSDTLVAGGEGYDSVYVDDSQGGPGSVRFALAGTNVEFVYGGMGNDVFDASGVSSMVELWGQWGDDVLTGGSGDDTLLGDEWLPGGGNDVLDGGAGNDWLDGGNGNDTFVFRVGSGVDTLYDFGQTYHYDPAAGIDAMEPGDHDVIRIEGGPFANFAALAGSGAMVQSGANVVITLSAADQITLRNVQLGTLDAADFLFTNQVINGTSNADALSGQGSDTIHGFGGNDLITGTGNTGVAFGDDGGDQLYFTGNQNQLFGGEGNDWLGVNGNNNALVGGAGDEVWIGASGNGNTLAGGDGGDALFANGAGNYLHGENGNDWLGVSGTQNRLFGGAGSEWMGASGNDNVLYGGEGGDTLFSVGANVLYGQTGDDWIGCSGNGNVLDGAQGNDYLAASGNNNTLDGGAGNDILVAGGAHSGDRFVFHVGYGMDTVVNFSRHGAGGSDVVDLNGFGLNFGSLQAYTADVGGNVVITLDAATILTIDGITKGQLQAGDFLF